MRFRKRKGSFLIQFAFAAIILVILSAIPPTGGSVIKTTSDNNLKNQAYLIDNALSVWHSSHGGRYPNSLDVLDDLGLLSKQIPLNQFTYTLQNNQTGYRLAVTLSNGSIYVSAGSRF